MTHHSVSSSRTSELAWDEKKLWRTYTVLAYQCVQFLRMKLKRRE